MTKLTYQTREFKGHADVLDGVYVTFDEVVSEKSLWQGPHADRDAANAFVVKQAEKAMADLIINTFRL